MILSILIAIFIAKRKNLSLKPMFHCTWLLPIVIVELIYWVFQCSIFLGYYGFLSYAELLKRTYLYVLFLPILRYQLYRPALTGSVCILAGTFMNRTVIAANNGKMPVFPTLSKWTGYFDSAPLAGYDSLHCLGNSETKLNFLSDYIDIGFSILSPGDLFIHAFTIIILYYTIKQLNTNFTY